MTYPDVFTLLDRKPLPEDVYIVGSGPAGVAGMKRIPADACTVALNTAIRYEDIFTYWIAFDCGMRRYPWWPTLTVPAPTINIFGHTLISAHRESEECTSGRITPHYQFQFYPIITGQSLIPGTVRNKAGVLVRGALRGGASIASVAIQFAAWGGAKRIILCGVDMKGNGHFDGYCNPNMTAAIWNVARKVDWVCEALRRYHRINVVSLTPTALKVPRI